MTIEYVSGNILEADTQALVNPVNCEGVMGKGLAYQFKQAYPLMFYAYRDYCLGNVLKPGRIHVYTGAEIAPRVIFNLATKNKWRGKSKLDWIALGLNRLASLAAGMGIESMAIPAVGCGEGGLAWPEVSAVIEKAMFFNQEMRILIYPPQEK